MRIKYYQAILAVILLWAVAYLPSLGRPDATRNEGRRILPAVTMLESGDWLTPMLTGKPYYRKPPMVNWLIASAFAVTGSREVLLARLAVALSVLAFAVFLLFQPSGLLDSNARLLTSGFFLTTVGLVIQGRHADIDPVYVCASGAALVLWLGAWSRTDNGWRRWLPSALMLAIGILLKGPLVFLFFYIMVCSVLLLDKRGKDLLSPWHFVGIVVAIAPFLIWSWLSKRSEAHMAAVNAAPQHAEMASVWFKQMAMRFHFGEIGFGKWLSRVFGGVAQFLPWLLAFPLLWSREIRGRLNEKQAIFAKSARFAVCASFIVVSMMPLTKARYSMPLLPLIVISGAMSLSTLKISGRYRALLVRIFTILFAACALTAVLIPPVALVFSLLCQNGRVSGVFAQRFLTVFDPTMFKLTLLSSFISIAAFVIYLRIARKGIQNISQFALLAILLSCVIINLAYTSFQPLTMKLKASDFATEIENFFPKEMVVCGIDYVGEEPFMAHVARKWRIFDKISDIPEGKRYTAFILDESRMNKLHAYAVSRSFQIAGTRHVKYKKHPYVFVSMAPEASGSIPGSYH